ncbi:MAG TPA: class I SAM-dependent rRNA methyltransferase [Bacilli bacterium]|nr:class I SAM-dependent rRNA methyltransferase [Bacilli bacterium]
MTKVILKKKEHLRIQDGHPWIFSNEVHHFQGNVENGDIVDVVSFEGEFVAKGFINLNSKIIVRVLSREDVFINKEFFKERIRQANSHRVRVGYQNAYRVVFGESDLLPGLIIDKYDQYFVIQTLSFGMDLRKNIICEVLEELFHPLGIYERNDVPVREKEGLELKKGFIGKSFNPVVKIKENGITLQVDLENGQKTGYFLDQQDNRKAIEPYVRGMKVLDCFSHTGGFALHAAQYGAKEVTALDISEQAVKNIEANIKLNNFKNVKTQVGDVFHFLRQYHKENEMFDVIILDPPAFTKSKGTVDSAYRGYKEINLSAMKIIKSGGYLITFSCSQHLTPALFMQMLVDASIDSKRVIQMVEFRTQSKDHLSLIATDESFYLKCMIARVL